MQQSTNGKVTNTKVANSREPNSNTCDNLDLGHLAEDFHSKKAFCQDLENCGLLHLLSLGKPEQLGFTFEWYRHSYWGKVKAAFLKVIKCWSAILSGYPYILLVGLWLA
jgi:hypothetical protein